MAEFWLDPLLRPGGVRLASATQTKAHAEAHRRRWLRSILADVDRAETVEDLRDAVRELVEFLEAERNG